MWVHVFHGGFEDGPPRWQRIPISIRTRVWHLEGVSQSGFVVSAIENQRRVETPARKRAARRSRSIRVARIAREEVKRAAERADELEHDLVRPRRRQECIDGPRPCPHVACRHHLYLDVNPSTGTIKLNFPELEVWELGDTCALDVAERGGTSLEDLSVLLNVTRERVRQIETQAMAKLASVGDLHELRQLP